MNTNEIQQADPRARKQAMWIVALAAVVGSCVVLVFSRHQDALRVWLDLNWEHVVQNSMGTFLVVLVFVSPLFIACFYLFALGCRIVQGERFPPVNFAVTRDTRVLSGPKAVRRGRTIQILSLLLLVASGMIPCIVWSLFQTLR